MNELLNKISSYNIFNYFLPGIIFSILTRDVIRYPNVNQDILAQLFLYYFIGLVISRLGSLLVEPALKKIGLIRFEDYKKYVDASKKDPKIELLSEANNTYRTLSAVFAMVLVLRVYARFKSQPLDFQGWGGAILAALLLTMFLFSYVKQTGYIRERIRANL